MTYIRIVNRFLDYAFANRNHDNKILCTCRKSNNFYCSKSYSGSPLIFDGFHDKYDFLGETSSSPNFETVNTVNTRVKYNIDIHKTLNDNFSFRMLMNS